MAGGRVWTIREDADLRRLYPDTSYTEEDLERHFGRTWTAIKIRGNRLGLVRPYTPHRTWTDEQLADLARMYPDESISHEQLEQHFGRNIGTISKLRLGSKSTALHLTVGARMKRTYCASSTSTRTTHLTKSAPGLVARGARSRARRTC